MAVNLGGKADASIVAAAYRAGAALKGPDYSESFKRIGTAYETTMKSFGEIAKGAIKVAEQAAKNLVNTVEEGKDEYGDQIVDQVTGDIKGLLKTGLDIFKTEKGSEERVAAKEKFQKDKDAAFDAFRNIRDKTLYNAEQIKAGLMNNGAMDPEDSMFMQALAMKGEAITEGPLAGVYTKLEKDANGEYVLNLYGKDGQKVTGINEDGSPRYSGARQISRPTEGEDKTQILRKTRTNQKIRAYLPLEEGGLDRLANEGYTRYKVGKDGLLTDEIAFKATGPGAIETTQIFLNEMGYTDADGEPLETDGKLGPKTRYAFEQFRKDQEKRKQVAGSLFSDISMQGEDQLSLKPGDINKLIVTKELETRANLTQLSIDAINNGQKGLEFREHEVRNQISEMIDTDNKFKDVTHSRLANSQYSYAEALAMPGEFTAEMWSKITGIAANMPGATDVDGDGDVDEQDFSGSDANNMMILRKAMLNPYNPEAKEIFADWYHNEVKKDYDSGRERYDATIAAQKGDTVKNDLGLTKDRTYSSIHYKGEGNTKVDKYVTGEDIDNESMLFKSIEDQGKGGWTAYNGASYRFDDGQWYKTGRDKDGELLNEIKVPRNTVLNDLGWLTYPSVIKRIGATPVKKESDFIFGGSNFGPLSQYKKNKDGNYTVNGKVVLFKNEDGLWRGQKSKNATEDKTSRILRNELVGYEKQKENNEFAQ